MKKIVFISLFIIFVILFFPIPFRGENGLYNTFSGTIYCQPKACVHEVGHKIDHMGKWPSKSQRFTETVIRLGFDFQLATVGAQETYAELFAFAKGQENNMPAELRRFYDWELSDRILARY